MRRTIILNSKSDQKLKEHQDKVKLVQRQVAEAFENGQKIKINHGSTNSTRPQNTHGLKIIDISSLNSVIEVNPEEHYVIVEPNVAMDLLADSTLSQNLIAPIITEFPGITVAGAVMGGAGESSSFKYGCVSEICLEYEIILGDGSRIVVSTNQNKDLFDGVASSYGTLGIITQIKLQLITCKQYVQLNYRRADSFAAIARTIEEKTKTKADFVDGIMFSKSQGVVMTGTFTEEVNGHSISTFHKASDEWFYIHAQSIALSGDSFEEIIPTRDYLFRYDRGAFWTGKFGFDVYHAPFLRSLRFIFAWLFKTRRLYRFLHGSNLSQHYLVQDLCMPKQNFVKFANFIDQEYGIYPLWLCPLKPNTREFLSPIYNRSDLIINVGMYGDLKLRGEEFVYKNRLLENKVQSLNGRKVLYAHSYYSEESFWDIYGLERYQKLRQKYKASSVFPSLFAKMHVSTVAKPSLSKGWAKLFVG
jgi:Delta24-sterol reductase